MKGKLLGTLASLSVAVFLTGCSGQAGTTSSTAATSVEAATLSASPATPTANPNVAGCRAFADANNELAGYLTGGAQTMTVQEWKAAQAASVNAMDQAGLTTTGAVEERIAALVSIIPAEPIEMALTTGRDLAEQYNTSLDRISNACAADGAEISLSKLIPAPKF